MESCNSRQSSSKRSGSGSFVRVLFVDDDATIRAAFARSVGGRGFAVDVASSAEEARQLCERLAYPVVATDLSMPGEGGISLIRHLHTQNPLTQFVVVTGHPEIEVPTEPQFRESVVSIIAKPWDNDALIDTLHRSARVWSSRSSLPPPTLSDENEKYRVLLLEDNDSDATLLEAFLAGSVYHRGITRTRRLSEALEKLEQDRYGVIVADLTLPDARGLDAVLRIQNVTTMTPLVVMSGVRDDAVAVQAVQSGAQDFLLKGEFDGPGLVRSIRYAQARKQTELDLTQLAHFDPLTGLANRNQFNQRLGHTLARARRSGDRFALLFVDLDNFKPINDYFGHAGGDAMLVAVGQRLESSVRDYDTVARLGGDEFGVILDSLSEPSEATKIADRMLRSIARPVSFDGHHRNVTASIGIAMYPDAAADAPMLVKTADAAMYAAKRRGRNTFCVARSARNVGSLRLAEVWAELNKAVRSREFSLHYQPVFDVRAGRVVAAEGLLRWNRNGHRLASANEFVPMLEESGAIRTVGTWALAAACREIKQWRADKLPISRVSVNVSVQQIEDEGFVDTVRRTLYETGVEPSCLELEVTESAVMQDIDRARIVLSTIKSWGVRIAMDDFGTGQSSLSYLYRLPIDTVKIDRSFVVDLDRSTQCRAVTRGIIALAKQLELDVVAEGVETGGQTKFLGEAGCDLLQGYLFGRPSGAQEFARAIRRSEPPIATHST